MEEPLVMPEFIPEKIYIEKKAQNSYLAKKFKEKFPNVKTELINYSWEYANDAAKPES